MNPDAIIACMHWGIEYQSLPDKEQKFLTDWLLRKGVNHIIGCHPHVVQPIEVREDSLTNGKHLVVYSLGNYISNMSARRTDGGLMVKMELVKDSTTRLNHCEYSLVWTARPAQSGKKNHQLLPINFPTDSISVNARNSLRIFANDAKDLSIKFLPYSLFISILFSAIISLIYAKIIKNNIQEIKIVTDKMMKLDRKTRLKVSSNDEVGELKQQINDLYSTLLRTIDNLEFKNKEILKLEKLKYDFFKGASHELKTPLASLKIILENMKYNIGKYKERDIYINECIDIVDSLTKNISQILSVHSIENLNNDEEYLKINDTLEDILKKYEILANQKKITVNNYISDENIYIGKTALKIILSNLISNAIKYTDVNGVINIGIVDDWLYIENSYGNNRISNMDEIFDVKFDLNKENSNGLGLYIVSNILNNYNIEYKALQDEEFFIFKIKIFS